MFHVSEFLPEVREVQGEREGGIMKIKEGCTASTGEFWYDLTDGGYINPEEILEDPQDVKRVNEAIKTIKEFRDSCEDQIDDFFQ